MRKINISLEDIYNRVRTFIINKQIYSILIVLFSALVMLEFIVRFYYRLCYATCHNMLYD